MKPLIWVALIWLVGAALVLVVGAHAYSQLGEDSGVQRARQFQSR